MDSDTDLSSLECSVGDDRLSDTALSGLVSPRAGSPPLSADSEELAPDRTPESLDWMQLVAQLARLCRVEERGDRSSGTVLSQPSEQCLALEEVHPTDLNATGQPPVASTNANPWTTQLEHHLNCLICAELPREPLLCPSCGVLFCERCATKWWREPSTASSQGHRRIASTQPCPHCRQPVARHELVLVRCLRELLQNIRRGPKLALPEQPAEKNPGAPRSLSALKATLWCCSVHAHEAVRYYCQRCNRFICAECCAPLPECEHRYHPLERAHERLQSLASELEQGLQPLRERLQRFECQLLEYEQTSRFFLRQREALSQRIQRFMDSVLEQIDTQVQQRIQSQQAARTRLVDMRMHLRRLLRDMERRLLAYRQDIAGHYAERAHALPSSAESLLRAHQEWKERWEALSALSVIDASDAVCSAWSESAGTTMLVALPEDQAPIPLKCAVLPPFVWARVPGTLKVCGLRWQVQWMDACSWDATRSPRIPDRKTPPRAQRPTPSDGVAAHAGPLARSESRGLLVKLEHRPGLEREPEDIRLQLEFVVMHQQRSVWGGLFSVNATDGWQAMLDVPDTVVVLVERARCPQEELQVGLRFPDIVEHSKQQTAYIQWMEQRQAPDQESVDRPRSAI